MAKKLKDQGKIDELATLFPGKGVMLGSTGIEVLVEPMGVRHIKRFSDVVAKVLPHVVSVFTDMVSKQAGATTKEKLDAVAKKSESLEASDMEWISEAVARIAPICIGDFLIIIEDCCDITFDTLPQHLLPPIINAWIEETFGDPEKIQAWVGLAGKIISTTSQALASEMNAELTNQENDETKSDSSES